MNLKEISTEQVKDYIRQELAKGREMEEIVKELLENRDDVILLSNDDATAEQQIRDLAERDRKRLSGG